MNMELGKRVHLQAMSSVKLYHNDKFVATGYIQHKKIEEVEIEEIMGESIIGKDKCLYPLAPESRGCDFYAVVEVSR